MSNIFIGTSGWSYEHWRDIFYPRDLPQSKWLEYYIKHFDTVELNTSFYHLPKRKTFENWRKRVGDDSVFSVKGSRYITHVKKLKDCQEPVERFFGAAEGVKNSQEVILWQLAPSWKVNLERLKDFLSLLPKNWRYAFELRNETWLTKEVFKILRDFGAAVVFQDFEHWPMTEEATADFVYLRLHGKKELYASCYTKEELENWAKKIFNWLKNSLDVYCYFNNDMRGYAVRNAEELRKMIND
jgi:uncharacterized protein YecE (DUF72 family)